MRRVGDGWDLLERSEFDMTMVQIVIPPPRRIAVDIVNPLADSWRTWTLASRSFSW